MTGIVTMENLMENDFHADNNYHIYTRSYYSPIWRNGCSVQTLIMK